jgi:phosphatidylserine decarboxylase
VASREECSQDNEQNVVTVTGDGTTVIFKQIAGLIARRIVCTRNRAMKWARASASG